MTKNFNDDKDNNYYNDEHGDDVWSKGWLWWCTKQMAIVIMNGVHGDCNDVWRKWW
jgi:hypothetical protein